MDDGKWAKIDFNGKNNYIYFNELKEKSGKRYNDIILNNLDLTNYSPHSPSCFGLFNVLKNLDITINDEIMDIGSGKGFALLIMNLFPFKKIYGIEASDNFNLICKNNLELINKYKNDFNLNRFSLINQDVQNFEFTKKHKINYFYFYNPFTSDIFEYIIKNISQFGYPVTIIYKNIHKEDVKILEKYNFEFFKEFPGNERNYFVYISK